MEGGSSGRVDKKATVLGAPIWQDWKFSLHPEEELGTPRKRKSWAALQLFF